MKKLVSILLSAMILSSSVSMTYASTPNDTIDTTAITFTEADYNAAIEVDENSDYYNPDFGNFVESIQNLPLEERMARLSSAPSKYSFNERFTQESNLSVFSDTLLPNTYNSSITYPANVSGFQNQGDNREECSWLFAANAALEAKILKGTDSSSIDLSEEHLRHSISNATSEFLGYVREPNEDGDFNMALSYWTRNDLGGPVPETEMPYSLLDTYYSKNQLNDKVQSGYKVKDSITLSSLGNPTNAEISNRINDIKQLIYDYGNVYVRVPYDVAGFNSSYTAYYLGDSDTEISNPLTLIGWNDYYSTINFGSSKPTNTGAFVAVDSREIGTYSVHYYYLSYDMVSKFGPCSSIKSMMASNTFDLTYENETRLRETLDVGTAANASGNKNAFAEKFEVTNNDGMIQKISAVSTHCPVPNSYYKIYIGTDASTLNEVAIKDTTNSTTINGVLVPNSGYHTFELEESVEITEDSFWVGIEVYNSTNNFTIPTAPTYLRTTNGNGMYAANINELKSGSNTTVSNGLIVKAHINYSIPEKKLWNFADNEFKSLGNIDTTQEIDGLTIAASTERNMKVEPAGVLINGIRYDYRLNVNGEGSGDYRKLSFVVNEPVDVYVLARSSSLGFERTLLLADVNGVKDSIAIDQPGCYKLSYSEEGVNRIYLSSEDSAMHIYAVGYRPKGVSTESSSNDNKDWWFDSEEFTSYDSGEEITECIETAYGLTIEASATHPIKIIRSNNHTNGFTYHQSLNLMGSGMHGERRILFDVNGNMDVYITAAHTGDSNETRNLYLTNEFNNNVVTSVNGESANWITVNNQIKTYKIPYCGYEDKLALYSANGSIRIFRISLVSKNPSYSTDDFSLNISDELVNVGTYTSNIELDSCTILAGTSNGDVSVVSSENTYNNKTYSKALLLSLPHPSHVNNRAIKFICDEENTNIKCIFREGSHLILANDYAIIGEVDDSDNTDINAIEYNFTNGDYIGNVYIYSPDCAYVYEVIVGNPVVTPDMDNVDDSADFTDEVSEEIALAEALSDLADLVEENINVGMDEQFAGEENYCTSEDEICDMSETAEIIISDDCSETDDNIAILDAEETSNAETQAE